MKINCPHCGKTFTGNGIGRKPLDILGNKVYATLQGYSSTTGAAQKLGVSRGWVNNWIKQECARHLMTRAEFLKKYMPDFQRKKPGPKIRKHHRSRKGGT